MKISEILKDGLFSANQIIKKFLDSAPEDELFTLDEITYKCRLNGLPDSDWDLDLYSDNFIFYWTRHDFGRYCDEFSKARCESVLLFGNPVAVKKFEEEIELRGELNV